MANASREIDEIRQMNAVANLLVAVRIGYNSLSLLPLATRAIRMADSSSAQPPELEREGEGGGSYIVTCARNTLHLHLLHNAHVVHRKLLVGSIELSAIRRIIFFALMADQSIIA